MLSNLRAPGLRNGKDHPLYAEERQACDEFGIGGVTVDDVEPLVLQLLDYGWIEIDPNHNPAPRVRFASIRRARNIWLSLLDQARIHGGTLIQVHREQGRAAYVIPSTGRIGVFPGNVTRPLETRIGVTHEKFIEARGKPTSRRVRGHRRGIR